MKKKLRQVLFFWLAISVVGLIVSFFQVRNSGEGIDFILWASWVGAFVWEDLMVFSLYNIVATIAILLIRDYRYILVFINSFWIVRSLGETRYWFLQQFNQPTQYPHNYYAWHWNPVIQWIPGNISDQKYFIIFQVFWQVVTVFAFVGIVYVFKNWDKLGQKLNGNGKKDQNNNRPSSRQTSDKSYILLQEFAIFEMLSFLILLTIKVYSFTHK